VFLNYATGSIADFEKVEAPKGTYPWTWSRLRLALLNLRADQPEKALEHARAVADAVEMGPEKIMALNQAAVASWRLGQIEQARRYYQIVQEAPDVQFPDDNENALWAPPWWIKQGQRFVLFKNSTRFLAEKQAGELEEKPR